MALGDWAAGSKLKPLRAVVSFDASGNATQVAFECEVYAPSGRFIRRDLFPWVPPTAEAAATVDGLASQGLADVRAAEGLEVF